jgi:hypothetical protein
MVGLDTSVHVLTPVDILRLSLAAESKLWVATRGTAADTVVSPGGIGIGARGRGVRVVGQVWPIRPGDVTIGSFRRGSDT